MAEKKKGITGHDDIDKRIDAALEKHGGSIKPSDSSWGRVWKLMDQANQRDRDAKAATTPAQDISKRGRPKKTK